MPAPKGETAHGTPSAQSVSLHTTVLRARQQPVLLEVLGSGLAPREIVGSLGSTIARAGPVALLLEVPLPPGQSTPVVPHQGNEILLYVVEGTLEHSDPGQGEHVKVERGGLVHIIEGPGSGRQERNAGTGPARFLLAAIPLPRPTPPRLRVFAAKDIPIQNFPGGVEFQPLAGPGSPIDLLREDLTLEAWSIAPEQIVAFRLRSDEGFLLWVEGGRFTLDAPGPPRVGPLGLASGDALLVESAAEAAVRLLCHAPEAGQDRSSGRFLLWRFSLPKEELAGEAPHDKVENVPLEPRSPRT
jgi:redox-sensitive bicupin YhaK (pirin superfamily)